MKVEYHEFSQNQKLLQIVFRDLWARKWKIVIHGIEILGLGDLGD